LHRSVVAAASLAAVIVAGTVPAHAVNLVTNGSFEVYPSLNTRTEGPGWTPGPNNNGWAVFGAIAGWTTSGKGIELQYGNIAGSTAQHGDIKVELDSHPGPNSNSAIQQALTLGKGRYELSFWYKPRETDSSTDPDINTNTIRFGVTENGNSVLDDYVLGSKPANPLPNNWLKVTSLFTILSSNNLNTVLKFAADGKDETLGGLIDNVSLTAIPLPPAALLLGGGLLGLGYLSRRRKAAQAA
jgi:hypothetical protein